MIPRFSRPYTSMDRSVALLCLIGLDRSRVIFRSLARYRIFRSRVISGYSRDLGYNYIPVQELLNLIWKLETGRGMMRVYRDGSRTGFLGALAPSVSIKDRSLLAVPIGD